MLFEMACADAYGIAFEFVDDPAAHGLINDGVTYQQHPEYAGLKPSQYTDDTQRSIANAHVVLGYNWHDPCAYVRAMQEEFRRDPRDGYSRRFQQFMIEHQHTYPLDWLRAIPLRRETNGAIMGAAPLGYLSDPVEVRLAANMQAMTTHSITTATHAQTIALAAHYFIYRLGDRSGLMDFLKQEVEGVVDYRSVEAPEGKTSMRADLAARRVLQLLHTNDGLMGIVQMAVGLKGDTDSAAALAVAIASCSTEWTNDLPESLKANLEFGNKAVHDRLQDLDLALRNRADYERKRSG